VRSSRLWVRASWRSASRSRRSSMVMAVSSLPWLALARHSRVVLSALCGFPPGRNRSVEDANALPACGRWTRASLAEGRLTIGLKVTNLPHSKWPKSRPAGGRVGGRVLGFRRLASGARVGNGPHKVHDGFADLHELIQPGRLGDESGDSELFEQGPVPAGLGRTPDAHRKRRRGEWRVGFRARCLRRYTWTGSSPPGSGRELPRPRKPPAGRMKARASPPLSR
jgi:hypothetical protein